MKWLRLIVIAIGLTTTCLLAPAWSASTQPVPESLIYPSETGSIYLAQQKSSVDDADQSDQKAQEDLWGDEDMDSDDSEEEELTIADPLYYLNKGIWHFNDVVYLYVGEPAARGYNKILPETVRGGVTNFFSNWLMPVRFVNCLLQAKWEKAGTEVGRFLVNTTFGILGFADMAKEEDWTGWDVAQEDLGQTFGYWGMGHGIYLVLPVIGPSSLRDGAGRIGDTFLDPITYLDIKWYERLAIVGYREFANYAPNAGEYEKFKEMSLDPYTAMRNAYIQYRARKVAE